MYNGERSLHFQAIHTATPLRSSADLKKAVRLHYTNLSCLKRPSTLRRRGRRDTGRRVGTHQPINAQVR